MAQFSQVIDGLAEACIALETPITGGNVSFYNETLGEAIYPTPTLGIVGILQDVTKAVRANAAGAGRAIVLLTPGQKAHSGEEQNEFGSSEFAAACAGRAVGRAADAGPEGRKGSAGSAAGAGGGETGGIGPRRGRGRNRRGRGEAGISRRGWARKWT